LHVTGLIHFRSLLCVCVFESLIAKPYFHQHQSKVGFQISVTKFL